MEIIQQRHYVERIQHFREFTWRDTPGAGFSFECDEHGHVEPLNEAALENWNACIDGTYDVIDNGVHARDLGYWEPKIGRCQCGREVDLSHFTNTCECGIDYNSSGTQLGPREFWGEETGEHLSDILRIP